MPGLTRQAGGKPKKLTPAPAYKRIQSMGASKAKKAKALNAQAFARLAAHKARLLSRGIAPKVVAKAKPQHIRKWAKAPKPLQPIKLQKAAQVYLQYTHIQWFMGVARYYTMPGFTVGYLQAVNPAQQTITVYIPKPPAGQPGGSHIASINPNGLQHTYTVINPSPAGAYLGILQALAQAAKAKAAKQASRAAAKLQAAQAALAARQAKAATKAAQAALAAQAQALAQQAKALAAGAAAKPPKPPKAKPPKQAGGQKPKPKAHKYKPGLQPKKPKKFAPKAAQQAAKAKALHKAAHALAALQQAAQSPI